MSDSTETVHEPAEGLSPRTADMHRALASLREELEAVDWYRQRADACGEEELRKILVHNMHEEIEHASMLLEWLRRQDPVFHHNMETYLFAEGDILTAERQAEPQSESDKGAGDASPPAPSRRTIGSLKEAL